MRRQTLLFSATMTRSLVALQAGLQDAFHFQVTPYALIASQKLRCTFKIQFDRSGTPNYLKLQLSPKCRQYRCSFYWEMHVLYLESGLPNALAFNSKFRSDHCSSYVC